MKATPGIYMPKVKDFPFDLEIYSTPEFMRLLTHEFESERRDQLIPVGEWYCFTEDCVVREVRVRCKLHGEPMPEVMHCPVCKSKMRFHHWLDEETLVFLGETLEEAAKSRFVTGGGLHP